MWSSPVSLYAQGSESCTRPARRVVERSIPLPDCTGVKVFPYLLVLEKTLAFWIRFPYS